MAAHTTGQGEGLGSDPFFTGSIDALRRRLLDLTGRNPLLNFRHGRTRRSLRVIDEIPDQLFQKLEGESVLRFKSIGEPDDEPEDEKAPAFRRALETARLDDEVYLRAIAGGAEGGGRVGGEGEAASEKALARAERELRTRVREKLGMVARRDAPVSTAADVAKRLGLDPSFDLALPAGPDGLEGETRGGEGTARAHHGDNVVQTLLFEEEMERTLSSIREHARLSISESGVNPLFCVFGFLEWYEEASSETPMHAPLMLYPLEIDYDIVRGKRKHFVASVGDGAQGNVALAERLKRDFGMALPEVREEETPDAYMARVAEVIAPMKGWRVRRWMTLGLFSFARISMYHDLDRARWTGAIALDGNGILTRLIAGGGDADAASDTEPGQPTPLDELQLPLIADADSSQAEAIGRALAGRSMVIEGPPGTGKSQTITNIIAGALANGKRVLFVAEKMAALSVVKKRLDDAGLGVFCLELHSTKAGRREVFGAFARRLAMKPEPGAERDLRATLDHLGVEAKELGECVAAMGAAAGAMSFTTQRLLWKCTSARERTGWLAPEIDEVAIKGVEGMTDADVGRVVATAGRVERAWGELAREYGAAKRCPWFGVATASLDAMGASDVARRMGAFERPAAAAAMLEGEVRAMTGWEAPSVVAMEALTEAVEWPDVPRGLQRAVVGDASADGDPGAAAVASLVMRFCATTGMAREVAGTVAGERAIVGALEAAGEATDEVLAARTEALVQAGAAAVMQRVEREAARLREERERWGAAYRIEGLDAHMLRQHGRALRGAPALPWLSPAWWKARGYFKGIRRGEGALTRAAQADAMEELAAHVEGWKRFAEDADARALLGSTFSGATTETGAARAVVEWAARVRGIGSDPGALLLVDFLLRGSADRVRAAGAMAADQVFERLRTGVAFVSAVEKSGIAPELRAWVLGERVAERAAQVRGIAARVRGEMGTWREALDALAKVTVVDASAWVGVPRGEGVLDAPARVIAARAAACAAVPELLQQLCDALRAREDAEGEGLGPVIEVVEKARPTLEGLADAAGRTIYQSLVRHLMARSPALQRFTGERHESHRARFRELDRRVLSIRQRQIASTLAARRVDAGSDSGPKKQWTGLALVEHVAATPRTPTALRDVLDRAGGAVQQLMPCFMMSPLSVAQYLKPGSITFDLVIMDEASQMRPEDAIGAIARGAQVVIVGDPKQLPPTAFFMGTDATPDEESQGSAADEQSILDQGMATLRPIRRLKWHYRSRHASLIAYSNREFYDGELVVFPSPHHEHEDYGVRYVRVEEGVYGGRGVNPVEARRIAEEAVAYVKRHPERSLGLVALNQRQTERIMLEIDRLASENAEFEAWRKQRDGTLEPFFVKNLENVQGDERDAIFISTVYGKDERGAFFQRFGPINNQGGHRRLNVLYTRSKCHTVVFTSMDPGEIRADETSSWGARALKGYLAFAKSGVIGAGMGASARETAREPESEFEASVAGALREAGFDAEPQVGVGGYFIDIAVRHPTKAGEFVLGIECDGATYHSSASARDRDRLRQEVLERLGWRIHRIWSLDWFKSPGRERERLLKAVREAIGK